MCRLECGRALRRICCCCTPVILEESLQTARYTSRNEISAQPKDSRVSFLVFRKSKILIIRVARPVLPIFSVLHNPIDEFRHVGQHLQGRNSVASHSCSYKATGSGAWSCVRPSSIESGTDYPTSALAFSLAPVSHGGYLLSLLKVISVQA